MERRRQSSAGSLAHPACAGHWGLAVVLWLAAFASVAQTVPSQAQRGGTFTEPPVRVPPEYVPLGPDRPGAAVEEHPPLQLRLSAELPLSRHGGAGSGTQGSRPASPTLQGQLRWQPLEDPGWFLQLTFVRYLQGERQQPWHPDVVYAFGYDDFRPGGWSFGYANYTGTRLRPGGGSRFNFPQGAWTVTHRFSPTQGWRDLLLVGDGDDAACHAAAGHSARYARAAGGLGRNRTFFSLGCRYTRPAGWFAHVSAHVWPDGSQQQPWDPDYTYGLGWAARGGLTVQYANYSGNRWPGRPRAPGEGRLRSGSLSIGWAGSW